MFEDILRAARKANGETLGEPPKPKYEPPKPVKYDEPKKWHEKKWGVALALIICFPIGVIFLWQNPRYSNQIKGGVTAGIIFLFLFYRFSTYEPPSSTEYRYDSGYMERSYKTGYLSAGTSWTDDSGRIRKNSKRVKVEITGNTVLTPDGSRLTQIYFLEGNNSGMWGYVRKSSLER